VRGTELPFPSTILRLKAFCFSRNPRSATFNQPQSPARYVKPFSMSSTHPARRGNPLISSIPDDVPLAYLFILLMQPGGAFQSYLNICSSKA